MDYKCFYQKNYRNQHRDRIKQQKKDLYNLYKTEYLPCIYCHKLVQLNACTTHVHTKKCKQLQESFDNKEELWIQYIRKINETKATIRSERDGVTE